MVTPAIGEAEHLVAVGADGVFASVQRPVVVSAEQHHVVERGRAVVGPEHDVVCIEVAGLGAARVLAPTGATGAELERPTLVPAGGAGGVGRPQGYTPVVHDHLDVGIAQEPGNLVVGEVSAGTGVERLGAETDREGGVDLQAEHPGECADVDVDQHPVTVTAGTAKMVVVGVVQHGRRPVGRNLVGAEALGRVVVGLARGTGGVPCLLHQRGDVGRQSGVDASPPGLI